ncbi:MAG: DUF2849 domain-containing protein [Pseudomonadota bacterium]
MKAVTANLLTDGRVVYLGPEGDWVERLQEAQLFADDAAADAALASVAARIKDVADAYLIDATEDGAAAGREAIRETIRNNGPTVRADLGKQSEDQSSNKAASKAANDGASADETVAGGRV